MGNRSNGGYSCIHREDNSRARRVVVVTKRSLVFILAFRSTEQVQRLHGRQPLRRGHCIRLCHFARNVCAAVRVPSSLAKELRSTSMDTGTWPDSCHSKYTISGSALTSPTARCPLVIPPDSNSSCSSDRNPPSIVTRSNSMRRSLTHQETISMVSR